MPVRRQRCAAACSREAGCDAGCQLCAGAQPSPVQVGINSAGVAISATESFNNRREAVEAGGPTVPFTDGFQFSVHTTPLPTHAPCALCCRAVQSATRAPRCVPKQQPYTCCSVPPLLQTRTAPTRACARTPRCRWCCRRPRAAGTQRSCWAACSAGTARGRPLAACSWRMHGGLLGLLHCILLCVGGGWGGGGGAALHVRPAAVHGQAPGLATM